MTTADRAYPYGNRDAITTTVTALAEPVAPKKKCKTESDFKVKSQM